MRLSDRLYKLGDARVNPNFDLYAGLWLVAEASVLYGIVTAIASTNFDRVDQFVDKATHGDDYALMRAQAIVASIGTGVSMLVQHLWNLYGQKRAYLDDAAFTQEGRKQIIRGGGGHRNLLASDVPPAVAAAPVLPGEQAKPKRTVSALKRGINFYSPPETFRGTAVQASKEFTLKVTALLAATSFALPLSSSMDFHASATVLMLSVPYLLANILHAIMTSGHAAASVFTGGATDPTAEGAAEAYARKRENPGASFQRH